MQNKFASIIQNVFFILPFVILLKIFLPWFVMPSINAGDWPYYGKGMFESFSILAPFWTGQNGIGLGGVNPNFPLFGYLFFTIGFFVNTLHIPWEVTYKLFWFGLALILGIVSIRYFYTSLKKNASWWEISLASFLFLCNSYFLMVVGGGQMGVAIAYTIAPLILGAVIKTVSNTNGLSTTLSVLRSGALLGVFLAIQMFFDSRIALLTVGVALLYIVYQLLIIRQYFIQFAIYWALAFGIVGILHSYWIVPFFLFKLLYIPNGITSQNGFAFFSFADFSHALSFLHPNWPENIFGKVYFLQPEFLIFPLFAFSGLLFANKLSKAEKVQYVFFCFVVLLGVFMAKGVNDPFPLINTWIFNHIPGFNLFRDPTKYYLLISLAYSFMIPLTVHSLWNMLHKKIVIQTAFVILVTIFFFIPVRQGIMGSLGGTFIYSPVPKDYEQLATFISSQHTYFRTLWIPEPSRFRYASEENNLLIAQDIFHTSSVSGIMEQLRNSSEEKYLEKLAIKYLIVPDDTKGEIFITDRKYDDKKRQQFINELDTLSHLKKTQVGKVVLYELPNPKHHFHFIDGSNLSSHRISSSEYLVSIAISVPQTLIFSESFHPSWVAVVNGKLIKSIETKEGLNSFILPAGNYTADVFFYPQKYQIFFYCLSGLSLVSILLFLLFTISQKK